MSEQSLQANRSHLGIQQRMPARVKVNGRWIELDLPCTIEQLLAQLNQPSKSVVVEHNLEAVPSSQFSSRIVQPGDQVEIIRIVAGG